MWPWNKKEPTHMEIRLALAVDSAHQRIIKLETALIELQVINRQIVAGNKIIAHQLSAIHKKTPASE